MSMDRCEVCDKIVDTDYDCEGYYFEDEDGTSGTLDCYICVECQWANPEIVEQHKENVVIQGPPAGGPAGMES